MADLRESYLRLFRRRMMAAGAMVAAKPALVAGMALRSQRLLGMAYRLASMVVVGMLVVVVGNTMRIACHSSHRRRRLRIHLDCNL